MDLGFLLGAGDTLQPNLEKKGEGAAKNWVFPGEVFRAVSRGMGSAVAHIFNGVLTWVALISSSVPQINYGFIQ